MLNDLPWGWTNHRAPPVSGTVSGLSLGVLQPGFVALAPQRLSPWGTEGTQLS